MLENIVQEEKEKEYIRERRMQNYSGLLLLASGAVKQNKRRIRRQYILAYTFNTKISGRKAVVLLAMRMTD